ncbi:MAG: hypothetical protein HY673_10545 [Chloroflexi bacterium]|nr:hypothetical protein [Chloroflexota bacterium]
MNELKPAGALDPVKSLLVLPDVVDTKLWYREQLPWVDNDTVRPIILTLSWPPA